MSTTAGAPRSRVPIPAPGATAPIHRRRTRETEVYALPLEFAFGVSFDALLAEGLRTRACTEQDLLDLGRRILFDLVRLARGEISHINVPNRLPYPGEYALRL